jgi:hypothetical protein
MPFPWVAAAKVIPWADVISAAPALAKGARELWKRSRSAREDEGTAAGEAPVDPIEPLRREMLRIDAEVETQAELIARLAEQQEQLVAALDRQRRRSALLLAIALLALLVALGALLRG